MPLDPFFAERLRTHRRYLLGRLVASWRERATALLPQRAAQAPPVAPTTTRPLTPREKHRRAALAWDRTELRTVGTPGPEVVIAEHTVPVPGYPDVRIRLYRPLDAAAGALPAFVSFYGGAFRIGGIDYPTTDAAARRRATDAGIVIVAVDYALAPEHRYPTAVEQSYAALDWVFRHADELGLDATRIGIGGTSAGGAIAAAVTLMNRDRAQHPLARQLLEVPVTDLTGRHIDFRATWALRIPIIIAVRELLSVARTYLPSLDRATEPYASPLRAASHADLPPALILTAEYDPLRGDGLAYGAALRAAGVGATVVRYLGVTHDTPIYTGALPAARAWHDQVVAELRRLHT